MDHWKKNIVAGNKYFNSDNLLEARIQYRYACQRALQLLPDWLDAEEAIAAILVSYHNMADLCVKENQPYLAQHELEHVYSLIFNSLESKKLIGQREKIFLEGLHRARIVLLKHMNQYGTKTINTTPQQLNKYSDNHFCILN